MKSNRYILGIPGFERVPKDKLLSSFFLVCASASVERLFSYFNKLVSKEREQLTEEILSHLMMLYFNSEKLDYFSFFLIYFVFF